MLTAERYPGLHSYNAMSNYELLEIHRSKISLHRAKVDYIYPTIRLPHTLSKLAGLPTRIYQTVHDGALAFLVVVSPGCALAANHSEKSAKTSDEKPEASVFTWRRSPLLLLPDREANCKEPKAFLIVEIRE
jgi:hypothetical protein